MFLEVKDCKNCRKNAILTSLILEVAILDFSKGVNPWFWSKIGHFPSFFILGNIGQENVFYDILQRKNAFLGYKNKKFKKSKN